MSNSLEILALRKQVLVARSTLARLRIRHDLQVLNEGKVARSMAFVARILPFAPLASMALNLLRRRTRGK